MFVRQILRAGSRGDSGVKGAMEVPSEELPSETPPEGNDVNDDPDHVENGMDVDVDQEETEDVNMSFVGCLEPSRDDFISMLMLEQMGAGIN